MRRNQQAARPSPRHPRNQARRRRGQASAPYSPGLAPRAGEPHTAMPYRLLALDLDGTLLDERKEISPANRDAIRKAQQAGLRVIIATARLPHTARPFAEQIGAAAPMIACVGAWNIMPDGSDDLTLFDPDIVRQLAEFADAEGLNLSITDAQA